MKDRECMRDGPTNGRRDLRIHLNRRGGRREGNIEKVTPKLKTTFYRKAQIRRCEALKAYGNQHPLTSQTLAPILARAHSP